MTSKYGPPECHLASRKTAMPQAADMWSLGCVFSEAATWLILGPPGLTQYTRLRKDAIRHKGTVQNDCFHDGCSVLPEVRQWHGYLAANLRNNDRISERILQIIEDGLLRTDPYDRLPNGGALCEKLDEIRRDDPHKQVSQPPLAIENAVAHVEARLEKQPIQPLLGPGITIQSRKALKATGYLQLPGNGATHRSEMIKERTEEVTTTPPLAPYPYRVSHGSGGLSAISEITSSRYKTLSTFDVHYDKPKPKRFSVNSIREKLGGSRNKDPLLAKHYQNRNIKFILDNSAGMIPEWQKARFVLEKIAKKAAGLDPDGMSLEFTNHNNQVYKVREKNIVTDIESAMVKHKPFLNDRTDMAMKLDSVLHKWLQYRQDRRKRMTLIVLTDGLWRGMAHTNAVEDILVSFENKLKGERGVS